MSARGGIGSGIGRRMRERVSWWCEDTSRVRANAESGGVFVVVVVVVRVGVLRVGF